MAAEVDLKALTEYCKRNLPVPTELPATAPHNETSASPDLGFIAARKAEVENICDGPVVWSAEISTSSPRWGYLWRGDFWEPKRKHQTYPTRIVCWTSKDGTLNTMVGSKWGGEPPLKL